MSLRTKFAKAAVVAAGLALSACSMPAGVSRAAPLQGDVLATGESTAALYDISINSFQVRFANNMRVSEANTFYPIADIVWRGDDLGDRRSQIVAIYQEAMSRSTAQFDGSRPVNVFVEVTRFHSLTERTRWSVGGTHSLHFNLTVSDAQTGQLLIDNQAINASFAAYGGESAYRAEQRGETQKVRVTARLEYVIRQTLRGQPFDG